MFFVFKEKSISHPYSSKTFTLLTGIPYSYQPFHELNEMKDGILSYILQAHLIFAYFCGMLFGDCLQLLKSLIFATMVESNLNLSDPLKNIDRNPVLLYN